MPLPQPGYLVAALQRGRAAAPVLEALATMDRTPIRTIRDTHPGYSAIAVDVRSDEVVLQDNNLWSTRVFNRLDNTPPGVELTEPKRVLQGRQTEIQFNNGLYIDPKNGDIYSVESDVGDRAVVFAHGAKGDVPPARKFVTPHRGYNLAGDEERNELYLTVEYPPEVVVYRKQASGDEKPLRRLQGDRTGLDAPHGLAVDVKNQLLFVNSWGHASNFRVQGTGAFHPPSIKVYPLDASGDVAPLRVIQGAKTQLNWPGAMSLDPERGDLYVANDVGQSILVFSGAARLEGDVAPARVIKGRRTGLTYPTGAFVDPKHQELWVSNMGNASATVYPLMASGDVPPLRTIRSAPRGKVSLNFGRTTAVAYDSKRQEILVPN
jgi:DNA-binding beta-propeller fold protein YncE